MSESMENKPTTYKLPTISKIMYLISTGFIILGFYKILAYANPEYSFQTSINSYVGGDAYNYIINSNYAGAYFTLSLLFVVLGSTFAIIKAISCPGNDEGIKFQL
jgi:hypothetical protein